jgi:hypothetical protein
LGIRGGMVRRGGNAIHSRAARLLSASTIKIGAITYAVVESELAAYGSIDYETQTISIRAGMSTEARTVTLWHEIIHGIMYNLGYSKHNELLVDGLAHGVFQALTDNPKLLGEKHV